MHSIEADYLVVGAGAMGMAFIDTLVSETPARIVMVDRNHQPGGHWTAAYPFARLHHPSAFYGVNSYPSAATRSTGPAGTRVSTNSRPQVRSTPTTTTSCASACSRRVRSAISR